MCVWGGGGEGRIVVGVKHSCVEVCSGVKGFAMWVGVVGETRRHVGEDVHD